MQEKQRKDTNVKFSDELQPIGLISVDLVWFGLVWFYGISTIVGYLKSNPFFIHINSSISNNPV